MAEPRDPRRWLLLPLLAAVLFIALAMHAAWVDAPTVDEFAHVPAGCAYLRYGRLDLYAKNPPLVKYALAAPLALDGSVVVPPPPAQALGWAPTEYGSAFMRANFEHYLSLLWRARLVNIAMAVATAAVLLGWCANMLGLRAACIASALLLLCPNIHAHGHLATTDVGSMLTIALTLWALTWAYGVPRGWKMALVGAAWGLALLAKFTAVLLLPALVVIALVLRLRESGKITRRLTAAALDMLITCGVALLVINLGMLFRGSFTPLREYAFMADLMLGLQRTLPWLPAPLPVDYLTGFDAQLYDTQVSEFGSYLMGQWSPRGWWYYNLVAMAVKTPVWMLVLMVVGMGVWWRGRRGLGLRVNLCVLAPLAVLLVMMLLLNRLNIGIRYLLPLWPLLFVLIAACWWRWRGRWADGAGLAAVGVAALTLLIAHPQTIRYFNGPSRLYGPPEAWLLDSNVDWGQDLSRLPATLRAIGHDGPIHLLHFGHADPALYDIRYELVPPWPVEGVVVVSVNYLHGMAYRATAPDGRLVTIKRDHLQWLRGREPVAQAGGLVVFRVSEARR